jgi:hypothetical protein
MPIEASAWSGSPGIRRIGGFSTKLVITLSSSTPITPKPLASALGTTRHPTVTSAPN